MPVYNLSGVHDLKFTPEILSGVYLGKTTRWNDPEIARVNPTASLPDTPIVVVHRSDGSGTTYVWTDYLSKVSPEWRDRVGTGISVGWPLGIAGKGNAGVAQLVASTPGSIGYVELTYAIQNRLSYGSVRNRAGNFITPDLASVTAAASGAAERMSPDFRISITDLPGANSYPIASFTWLLVPSNISDSARRAAIQNFLRWGLTKGQDLLEPLAYARLPDEIIVRENMALERIK